MRIRREVFLTAALALAVSVGVIVQAGTVSSGGVTLTYPEYPLTGPALESCEPWFEGTANTVTLTGVPEGSSVTLTFLWSNPYAGNPNFLPPATYNNVTGGTLTAPVVYPPESSQWPLWDQTTNERAIGVSVVVRITTPAGTIIKVNSKQWWIRCLPPPAPAQGCTPGYWKQDHHLDSWVPTGYTPTDDFEFIFGVDASFNPHTVLDALELTGGGERALGRHAVAALLNASHPDINYSLSLGQVIAGVQNAYATGNFEPFKDQLDAANNAGCGLN